MIYLLNVNHVVWLFLHTIPFSPAPPRSVLVRAIENNGMDGLLFSMCMCNIFLTEMDGFVKHNGFMYYGIPAKWMQSIKDILLQTSLAR